MTLKKPAEPEVTALLAAIVESSDDAIISKDLSGIITSWNKGAELTFGYTADEIIGKPVTTLIPAERLAEEAYILGQIRQGRRVRHYETIRKRKDGALIHVSLTSSPVYDMQGNVVGASKIARDITEKKRAEETQHLLMREVNHRSKNLLSIVQAVVHRTASGTAPDEFARRVAQRLQSLSTHQDLMIERDWRGAEIGSIVRAQLTDVAGLEHWRFRLEGPSLMLRPAISQALGMTLHELVSNALKFGALSNDSGTISVRWEMRSEGGEPIFTLRWKEAGGPPVFAPVEGGFGMTVIERLSSQSCRGEARLVFAPDGVEWTLTAPARGMMIS